MRSSSGAYYPGLDHLRALAAFLVFGWHFTHGFTGTPAPFGASATPFLAPFNEGHCGVALFMCLSGYLFARILDGKQVIWRSFYWNRFLRLAPLLAVGFAIKAAQIGIHDPSRLPAFVKTLATGFIAPTWDLGAWSIAVEIHFYLLLWIIIPLKRRWLPSLFCFLALGICARALIYADGGDVQYYAYWTIIGRIDQFILGIAAWEFRGILKGRHACMAAAAVAFFGFYQWLASIGGFYGTLGNRAVWIFIPTIEAAFFSLLVAYYDSSFSFRRRWSWRVLETTGAASYSIYLLHTFVVFDLAGMVGRHLPGMRTWEVAEAAAVLVFAAFVPIAWLSYRYIEMPFLRFRAEYTRRDGDIPFFIETRLTDIAR